MRQYDANRDGSVDFGEFRRYVAAKEAAIRAAFAALDVDSDGEVSQAELTTAMRHAGCGWQGQITRGAEPGSAGPALISPKLTDTAAHDAELVINCCSWHATRSGLAACHL